MANCIIRIHCNNCRKTWETYWRDVKRDDANICPFCGAELDRLLWDRDVVHAAAASLDANMELEKDAAGYHQPGFSVNFISRKDTGKNGNESY